MPIKILCAKCGYELISFNYYPTKHTINILRQILNYKCPKCGHILTPEPKLKEIKPHNL